MHAGERPAPPLSAASNRRRGAEGLGSGDTLLGMAELKTRPTDDSVERFVESIADEGRREDCRVLVGIMQQAGKGCLYLKKLEDAHLPTLKKLIQRSVQKA